MKKIEIEILAEYIDWSEALSKLNDVISETCKEISSIEVSYSESENEDET